MEKQLDSLEEKLENLETSLSVSEFNQALKDLEKCNQLWENIKQKYESNKEIDLNKADKNLEKDLNTCIQESSIKIEQHLEAFQRAKAVLNHHKNSLEKLKISIHQ